jgi:hypothetical protein
VSVQNIRNTYLILSCISQIYIFHPQAMQFVFNQYCITAIYNACLFLCKASPSTIMCLRPSNSILESKDTFKTIPLIWLLSNFTQSLLISTSILFVWKLVGLCLCLVFVWESDVNKPCRPLNRQKEIVWSYLQGLWGRRQPDSIWMPLRPAEQNRFRLVLLTRV